MYCLNEKEEVKRQLGDLSTCRQLQTNPFPDLLSRLNYKLKWAKEEGLLTKHEYENLKVTELNITTFYLIPKRHKKN